MELFKSRKFAWCVFAVLAVGFLLIGVNRSVASKAKTVETTFYNGVYDSEEQYTRPAIDEKLTERENAALGLITCASGYDALSEQTADLRTSRNALLAASSIPEKYSANQQLESTFQTLYAALTDSASGASETDLANAASYDSVFSGAENVIEQSGYNDGVDGFYSSVMGSALVRPLRAFIFVDMPDYFGSEE